MAVDFPTIPASFSVPSEGELSRGEIIAEVDIEDLLEAANYVVANRTNCLFSHSWMSFAVPPQGTPFYANTRDWILEGGTFTPSEGVVWVRWLSVAANGTMELRVSTESMDLDDATDRIYEHDHVGATVLKRETMIAVEPGETYFFGIRAEYDTTDNMDLWGTSLIEHELTEADLSMHVPEYATVTAAIADGIVAGDTFTVNGTLLYMRPAADFDYPGRTDISADLDKINIAVPYNYRDAVVLGVYIGGTAEGSSPHSDWGWSETIVATGSIGEALNVTTFTDGDAAGKAYVDLSPTFANDILIYGKIYCSAAGAAACGVLVVSDNDVLNEDITLDMGAGGTAGTWDLTTAADVQTYSAGAADYTQVLISINAEETRVIDYDTQAVILYSATAAFGASGASLVRVGCPSAASTGTVLIEGVPAVVVMEKP